MGALLATIIWLLVIGAVSGLLITTGVIIVYGLKRVRR